MYRSLFVLLLLFMPHRDSGLKVADENLDIGA
jgi:hypothetical protein